MRQIFGVLIAGFLMVTAFGSVASAGESGKADAPAASVEKAPQVSESELAAANGFNPDGFAGEMMNLMTGIHRPIDATTSLTIQAGKGLKIGITF